MWSSPMWSLTPRPFESRTTKHTFDASSNAFYPFPFPVPLSVEEDGLWKRREKTTGKDEREMRKKSPRGEARESFGVFDKD
jgi:hypothetical protein